MERFDTSLVETKEREVLLGVSLLNSGSASLAERSLEVVFIPHKSRYIALHVVP